MDPLIVIAVSVAAFILAASGDWLETRYVRAVRAWEDAGDAVKRAAARERAARSSVAMWLAGVIALVVVIEIGWFVLPFEAAGLYVGTKFAMR
jgi:uncharacterized BrkB/YihY/UPF0761 family membrane protein